jgi:sugar lactone lactonase YvrE
MTTKNTILQRSLGAAVFTGAFMLMAGNASAQNLFVSTYSSSDVYEISPGGTPTLFSAGFSNPTGLAFDGSGNLFVASSDNNAGESGYITQFTGGTPSTFATGIDPIGLAFNSSGNLFEADYNSGNIYEFAPGGGSPTIFAGGFSTPISLAFDSAGNLYVGSGYGDGNGIITKITPGGTPTLFASGLSFPNGMAFNSAGDLFVSSQSSGVITEITPDGTPSTFVTLSEDTLNNLAFNSAGDLFAACGHSGDIVEIAPDGTHSVFALYRVAQKDWPLRLCRNLQ